jgi:hypothetical protein
MLLGTVAASTSSTFNLGVLPEYLIIGTLEATGASGLSVTTPQHGIIVNTTSATNTQLVCKSFNESNYTQSTVNFGSILRLADGQINTGQCTITVSTGTTACPVYAFSSKMGTTALRSYVQNVVATSFNRFSKFLRFSCAWSNTNPATYNVTYNNGNAFPFQEVELGALAATTQQAQFTAAQTPAISALQNWNALYKYIDVSTGAAARDFGVQSWILGR